jgi:DNA-binding transcriptional LysR family regulator
VETLEAMRLLLKVVECGSLSAAGRAIGQSPASVSRKIAQLEDQVGAKLFNRTSRSLSLTNIGAIYHEHVAQIVGQIDNLNVAISEQQSVPRGTLNVRTQASIASEFLSDALPSFLDRYPDITLQLSLGEFAPDMDGNRIDLDIRVGMPDDPNLMIRRLSPGVERILYASPDYLAKHSAPTSPQDLLNHNCLSLLISLAEEQNCWFYRTPTGIKELRVAGNLIVNDAHVLHEAVAAGIGIGLLPAWMAANDLSSGRIVRILPNVEITQTVFDFGIYAVFRKSDLILPKIRVFVDFLVETFRRKDAEISRIAMKARRQSAETDRRAPDAMRWIHSRGIGSR